ncbi:membrane protein of unknown function [Acidithiobacillus ferrivorans]|uniref:Uncharacterized protein n=1 Tax=Acidithiobacillus ferrivorans TaxID=160808 RepID=A0ABY1MLU3_9PROT|nr:membrane protein of unknown function [Acidithiobacillus ferrivorans]
MHVGHALRYWCTKAAGNQPDDRVLRYLQSVYSFRAPHWLRLMFLWLGLGGLLAAFAELWFLLHAKTFTPPNWIQETAYVGLSAPILVLSITLWRTPLKVRRISAAKEVFGSAEAALTFHVVASCDSVSRWALPTQSGPMLSADSLLLAGTAGVAFALAIMPSVASFHGFLAAMLILLSFAFMPFIFVGLMMAFSTWHRTEGDTLPYLLCVFSKSLP